VPIKADVQALLLPTDERHSSAHPRNLSAQPDTRLDAARLFGRRPGGAIPGRGGPDRSDPAVESCGRDTSGKGCAERRHGLGRSLFAPRLHMPRVARSHDPARFSALGSRP
jgi:hypothetical protein